MSLGMSAEHIADVPGKGIIEQKAGRKLTFGIPGIEESEVSSAAQSRCRTGIKLTYARRQRNAGKMLFLRNSLLPVKWMRIAL